MGFYGNITNVNKTQFTFDAIFPSRADLENNILNGQPVDIYIGRYALVEYSSDATYDQFKKLYPGANGKWYTAEYHEGASNLEYNLGTDIENDEVVVNPTTSPQTFYICVEEGGEYKLKEYTKDPYTVNYNKDFALYKNTRGYDSTVWQKTFVDGKNKWVMIAELNSVVPTFDLSIDAPTMNPITPHFDINSTNVYYQLHWQPQWGFRVAEAESEDYSDSYTTWISSSYDKVTDELTEEIRESVPAAIYFNAAAFEEYTTNKEVSGENYISILPTGQSGIEYNAHNGDKVSKEPKKDIQEMRINLPIIGNVISKVWDIVHGPARDDSTSESLQGRLDFFTKEIDANEIPVQSKQGGYLVGAKINGGTKSDVSNILDAEILEDLTKDDAWIRTDVKVVDNGEYHQNAISIHHTFTAVEDTTSVSDVNGNGNTIDLYTPYVDAAGHVVGYNTETVTLPYGYKIFETEGKSEVLTDLYTADTVVTNIISTASNTQDSMVLNPYNKWIQVSIEDDLIELAHSVVSDTFGEEKNNEQDFSPKFGSTFNVPVITVDNAGHMTAFDTEEVKIPGLVYTPDKSDESDDVLLTLSYVYDENTDVGTFTETRGHVDKLLIQDYEPTNVTDVKLSNTDSIYGAFEKLQGQIDALDYTYKATAGSYISSITEADGKIEVNETALPDYTDPKYTSAKFVSKVTQDKGAITVEHVDFSPSVTIGAGTSDATPTIKINVGGNDSESQPINKASASVYGVTRLTNSYSSEGTSYAITGAGVTRALETLDVTGESGIGASKTISSWSETDGKVSITVQDISITDSNVATNAGINMNKIAGLENALNGKQATIPANTYDNYGSAESAKTEAINVVKGADTDTVDQLTLYGLKAYISSLQNTITTLTARIEALEGTTPPTETV